MIKNILSVDLESFVHRQLDVAMRQEDKGYIVEATNYLLDLFDTHNTKVTFFVLGEIFQWHPSLIKKIADQGHEIAYHGHRHVILRDKETLLKELSLSREFLSTYKPIGFRAPRMYFKKEFFKIIKDYGFKYDSSVYGNDFYSENNIKEFPVSVHPYFSKSLSVSYPQGIGRKVLTQGIPFGSGLSISLLQKKTQYFIQQANKNGKSAIVFIHPWQVVSNINALQNISLLQRFIYKQNINSTLSYLLSRNKFVPFREMYYES